MMRYAALMLVALATVAGVAFRLLNVVADPCEDWNAPIFGCVIR